MTANKSVRVKLYSCSVDVWKSKRAAVRVSQWWRQASGGARPSHYIDLSIRMLNQP